MAKITFFYYLKAKFFRMIFSILLDINYRIVIIQILRKESLIFLIFLPNKFRKYQNSR